MAPPIEEDDTATEAESSSLSVQSASPQYHALEKAKTAVVTVPNCSRTKAKKHGLDKTLPYTPTSSSLTGSET